MIDGRFHVASLVALFCALGTGLLIGGALTDNDLVRAQQQLWMDNIEADLKSLRAEKDALLADLHYMEQRANFADSVMADVATRTLIGSLRNCVIAYEPIHNARADEDALPTFLQLLGAVVIDAAGPLTDDALRSGESGLQSHVRVARTAHPPTADTLAGRAGNTADTYVVLSVPGTPSHMLPAQIKTPHSAVVPFIDTAAGQWHLVLTVLETGCGDEA